MTNFEKALEIIDRTCDENATMNYKAFKNALTLATVDEKSREYFRGFTQALYYGGVISYNDREVLRLAMYETIGQ